MNHVMIDIETLDLIHSAKLVSVGAVVFNFEKCTIKPNVFFETVDLSAQPFRTESKSTLAFWDKQSEETRTQLLGTTPLTTVLKKLAAWLPPGPIWANGDLDKKVLENCYRTLEVATPWHYNDWNDCRTLHTVFQMLFNEKYLHESEPKHNALDDATYQSKWVMDMMGSIRNGSL